MLLCVDTSAGTSLAVVSRDGEIIAERASVETMRHAELLGAYLHDLEPFLAEVTAVVAGVGPGPFTGLRVGLAAARGFAFAAGVPLYGLVSHDAAALAAAEAGEEPRFIVTDARRREFFVSDYATGPLGRPVRVAGPRILKTAPGPLTTQIPAACLGRLAAWALATGQGLGPADAVYLRSPDVTVAAAPKRVSS